MTLRCSKWVSHVFAAVPFALQFSHRVPALEKYVWPWRAPYYAWATITPRIQRDSWLWCHWHAPDIPSWMVHPTSNTFTQKKALCLGCSWRDWFWKVLANLAAVRPTAKRRETSHNVQKPPGCMDRVLRSKWPVHMFFSHSFRLCTKNIFKHDNACKLQNKKSTSKRPGKPNRNAIKYLWRLSQNLCARPQCCAAW